MAIDFEIVDEIAKSIAVFRQDLAEHPEVGPDVSRTAAKVVEQLEQTSLRVRARAGFPEQSAMGVIADLKVMNAERTVALVADMSAQKVRPQDASRRRCSHVSGNDAHTAMLVGTAMVLHRSDLSHNIRFVWQSGGEMLSDGAQAMIRDGALKDVDEVYAVHLWPGLELGKVGLVEGPVMASLDRFQLELHGPQGVRPWHHRKIDAIRIGAAVVRELDELNNGHMRDRVGAGALRCVVTHFLAARMDEGVPADQVLLEGELRALSAEERERSRARLDEVVRRCAAGCEGTARLKVMPRGNVTVNAAQSVDRARARVGRHLGEDRLAKVAPSAFSSGLSGYFEQVPGAMVPLGCGGETDEPASLLLSPSFSFDDRCLALGIRVLAALAAG
jgi:amidohydrolase